MTRLPPSSPQASGAGPGAAGLQPAFLDTATGRVYLAQHADGRLAAVHLAHGLPEELVTGRDPDGRVTGLGPTLVSGYLAGGRFLTRDQATGLVGTTQHP